MVSAVLVCVILRSEASAGENAGCEQTGHRQGAAVARAVSIFSFSVSSSSYSSDYFPKNLVKG